MSVNGVAPMAFTAATNLQKVSTSIRPEDASDPGKLAQFNVAMMNATTAYETSVQTIQTLHKEDQQLIDLLRDA